MLAFACTLYLFGLGSAYAPTNGDEMVYIHIARLTGQSGHWLPLLSDIANLRNTKPPLLFWQGMVAGDWGQHWSLLSLRLPSAAYTFATAALLATLTRRMGASLRTALLAAVLYLTFFSTFRYCRVYLTSAPETFWFSLPMIWALWPARATQPPADRPSAMPGLWHIVGFGLAMGIGLAYKSFALVAPVAASLWCVLLLREPQWRWSYTLRATGAVTLCAMLALAFFSLWFVIDPDPSAVWKEFVIGENAGKMSGAQGYWHAALYGDYPMWTQLLAYPENAGLLAFPVFGLVWAAANALARGATFSRLSRQHWGLLAWLAVWLLIFAIPSQRSARYVIPAMPALAILLALHWQRIARPWFWLTLALCLPALVLLARISWVIAALDIGSGPTLVAALLAAASGLLTLPLAVLRPAWTREAALYACLAVYATFNLMVAPLDSDKAEYSEALQRQLQGASVAVPNGFTGQYERFAFILPGTRLSPYDAEGRNTGVLRPDLAAPQRLEFLLGSFDAVVWLQDSTGQTAPPCLPACTLLGSRWHVKSRHKDGEVNWGNLWYPQEWLLRREWLLQRPHS
jgi:4-amino-4-deoxy-L-arabinose transferase-like glycosyltransferase